MSNENAKNGPRVAIVGGGLAGLAAAAYMQSRGYGVEIFESRRALGGRAGSFRDMQTGQTIDRCRHVAMGCCSRLIDFCSRVGISDLFDRHKVLHFFAPGKDPNRYDFLATERLPPPYHLCPAMMRLGYLSVVERGKILLTLRRLLKTSARDETIGQWLRRQGQSERAIERFWGVVLESALSEKLYRASLAAARKVFVDGFMRTRDGYELLIPRKPLAELFDRRVGDYLRQKGVTLHRGTRVVQIDGEKNRAVSLNISSGERKHYDAFIVAVPWYAVRKLFSPSLLAALPELEHAEKIPAAPITALHLWYDRSITDLPHAVLVGRLSQWFFNQGNGYSQVVVSASHDLVARNRKHICRQITAELQEVFPAARDTRLIHWRLVTEPRAVFSLQPGVEKLRPQQKTPLHNLALAGDWTDTSWPATMEGAVRSGYAAAEVIVDIMKNSRL
ncbi:MAG: FAD-dependent oxidoreductase [Pirellulales bacterium]|nr:FAD-dependent oxidoreductase [Pirellulales bacterium]